MSSPSRSVARCAVVLPTTRKTMVMVPAAASASAMVKGMRSPLSLTRRMTKLPGRDLDAIMGASTTMRMVWPGMRSLRFRMR